MDTNAENTSLPDRDVRLAQNFIVSGGIVYQATTNYLDEDVSTVKGVHLEQLNDFTGNETACSIDYDADTNETITTTTVDRANNKVTTVTSEPSTSSLSATNVYQNGWLISSSTLSVASPTLYFHDALGRTNQIESPLGFSTYMTYDPNTGWMTSMTDPAGHITSYSYYGITEANSGKLKYQTSATGKKTYYSYTTQGQLWRTWGDVPYPAQYTYNEYGDLTNLTTYRGGSGWTSSSWPSSPGTGDSTTWVYDEASGSLLKKIDAQTNATTYTYYPESGRLKMRSWQRLVGGVPVTVTNLYDTTWFDGTALRDDGSGFGDLAAQAYSDSTPNVYFNNYNRSGQPREIIDGVGAVELTYDFASRLVSSSYTNYYNYSYINPKIADGWVTNLLNGITVSNHFNAAYGRDAVSVLTNATKVLEDDYGYDSGSGRLAWVGSGNYTAYYSYVPNSDLLQSTLFENGANAVLTTTRTWDYGFQLRSIANVVNNAPVTSHSYQYDALNRRTQATLEDGSFWQYGYDDRDELTSAKRNWSYFSTTTPVSGQQFSYAYDTLGNRTTAQFGGDTNGANLQTISYTANSLNQYTGIVTPGLKDIMGAALATNSVSVNNLTADRKGEYFHRQISVGNTNQVVWQNVTNISGTFTNKGGLVFPANNQALVYDVDGNLSFDGIWSYQWDGENRLILMTMTNVSGISNSNRLQLQFAYDFMGRRVQKTVYQWNGSAFGTNPVSQVRFVYDGWNLLAEVATNNATVRSYMWGNDLSHSLRGAGGVGGLLMESISATNCFTAYDGNGNITALISAVDKSLVARYEYSPYGQLLRETGVLAQQNPFRYSSKYWDEESGLVYYNFRFYSPTLGKWIGRDPTTDQILLQLYLFCHNNPINRFDIDGKMDQALIWTGVANAMSGTALFGLLAAGDAATGGLSTLVSASAFVGSAMMVGVGLDEIFDGLTTQGSVSPHRNFDFDFPTSAGGGIGRIFGGQEGQEIGDFLDASAGLAQSSAELGIKALDRVVAADVAINLEIYAIAAWSDSDDGD